MAPGIRIPFACLTATLLLGGAGACGSASDGAGSRSGIESSAATGARDAARGVGADATHGADTRYRNDGDNDPSNDNDPDDHGRAQIENDHDGSEDNMQPRNDLYHDADDANILSFGTPANAVDEKTVKALVKRYYAAGAAGDGAEACGMVMPFVANSIARSYSEAPALGYLHGLHGCATVLSALFRHEHARFAGTFTVTGVRVRGDEAFAFLGSHVAPASYVGLGREHGRWMIGGLLGGPLS